MALKVYGYNKCGICRKAQKYLDSKGIPYQYIMIREIPPSIQELQTMLAQVGELKKIFNTSGQDYRALGIKDQLPDMSEQQALELLASNGNLIKRPFVLDGVKGTVGFKEETWDQLWG